MSLPSWKIFAASLLLAGAAHGQYTESDVTPHNSASDCWTVVNAKVYDVTSYAGSHPGGSGVVHAMCGKDGTTTFNSEHNENWAYMDSLTNYKGTFSGSISAAPAPSEEGGFCFSGISAVEVEGKGSVLMKNLRIGDKVLTDNNKYQPVYAFGHLEATKSTKFLKIQTEGNRSPLEITGAHMVYLEGKKNPVRADSVEVGDVLQSLSADGSTVLSIVEVNRKGLYAPLTPSGVVIVDGIKASSYIALQDTSVEYVKLQHGVMAMSQHDGIHMALTPFRMLCMATSAGFCNDYDEHGMPKHVAWGISTLKWFDNLDLPLFVQATLLGSAWLFFACFMVAEAFLGSVYAPAMVLLAVVSFAISKSLGIEVSAKTKKTV